MCCSLHALHLLFTKIYMRTISPRLSVLSEPLSVVHSPSNKRYAPALLTSISSLRCTVSLCSFGGLTSCFAASSMPAQFQRAFCMSPSVWWNAGEMSNIIASNFKVSGIRPLSVVVEVGTQEGVSIILSNYDPVEWIVFIKDMISALQGIGMGETNKGTSFGTELYPSSSSDLIYYTTAGGVHNVISWIDTISYGLPLLYQTNYPEANIVQRNTRTVWEYPVVSDASNDDDNDSGDDMMWIIIVVGLLIVLLPMNIYMAYSLLVAKIARVEESDKNNLL